LKSDAPRFGFGSADKDKNFAAGKVVSPGPGAYEHKRVVGVESQKRTMSARRPQSAGSYLSNPGPGQYTPTRSFSARQMPKYSIGRESRDGGLGLKHMRYTPAPNQYNPSGTTLTRVPSWVMGSS
jgi:hypothetical protein